MGGGEPLLAHGSVAVDGVDGPEWRVQLHLRRLGNVTGLTDSTGATAATYDYDPFEVPVDTAFDDTEVALLNPLRYRGYFYDDVVALYVLPARVYDPAIARFLSPDPAPAHVGMPQTANRYAYAAANPVSYVDPDGLDILLGNYYPPAQDEFEPDIPQQDWQPGGGYGTKKTAGLHVDTVKSSGQKEREAAEKRKAAQRQRSEHGGIALGGFALSSDELDRIQLSLSILATGLTVAGFALSLPVLGTFGTAFALIGLGVGLTRHFMRDRGYSSADLGMDLAGAYAGGMLSGAGRLAKASMEAAEPIVELGKVIFDITETANATYEYTTKH